MNNIDLLGYFAATLTTISGLPQLMRILKTKSAVDVSFWMFFILALGNMAWLFYGICIKSTPVIIANIVTLIITSSIVILKLVYNKESCDLSTSKTK